VKIYFASDFHLGVPNHASSLEREKSICRWLDMAAKDATEIYLLGDIFDFWFEYKHAVPRGFSRLLGTISAITDSGIPVTVFKGNHDMWMFGYLEEECGVKTVSDELLIERNSKTLFLHHGDGLGPGEAAYKWLRRVFRSNTCQWLFARLHPNFGIALAQRLSKNSRLQQKGLFETYMGDEKEFLTLFAKETSTKLPVDFFVFGHRHLPLEIKISEKATYINLGEWMHTRHYAVFDGTSMTLLQWNG
jgi:UDP-2,3-diacylglucosamine hydrolase